MQTGRFFHFTGIGFRGLNISFFQIHSETYHSAQKQAPDATRPLALSLGLFAVAPLRLCAS